MALASQIMQAFSYVAVVVAIASAFVASSIYYVALAKQRAALSPAAADMKSRQPRKMLAEVARNVILALVIAHFVKGLDIRTWGEAAAMSGWLWLGFPLILLSGSVMWERVPPKLAAIHGGDWLIKLLLMSEIVTLWR
jgi:hypothetical protein